MDNIKWVGALLGGIALGGLGVVLWPHPKAPKPAVVASPEDREAVDRVRTQTEYLATLRAVASAAQAPGAQPVAAPKIEEVAAPAGRPTEEEMKREIAVAQENQAERVTQHGAEPRDDGWASPMETKIDALVRARSNVGVGKYEGTNCRTQSCLVNVSWDSYAEARGDMRNMMARTGALPCSASLVLPADDGSGGRVSASVLLDCAAERNGTASAAP